MATFKAEGGHVLVGTPGRLDDIMQRCSTMDLRTGGRGAGKERRAGGDAMQRSSRPNVHVVSQQATPKLLMGLDFCKSNVCCEFEALVLVLVHDEAESAGNLATYVSNLCL